MKLLSCYLLSTFLASYWGAREEKEVSSSDTSKHKKYRLFYSFPIKILLLQIQIAQFKSIELRYCYIDAIYPYTNPPYALHLPNAYALIYNLWMH